MPYDSYFNAKLLLTAEYLVLNGAKALALPLKFGQRLRVEENELGSISWHAISNDGSTWFNGKYSLGDFTVIESSNPETAIHPQRLLIAARKLNPAFCNTSKGCHVISTLNYPLLWGLGSSSTLIAAVAGWAGIDPFYLHFEVSKGSGYDIACAISRGPIVYSLSQKNPDYQLANFSPPFSDKIYFVYQGTKQDSAEGISKYRKRNSNMDEKIIESASSLTYRMLGALTIHDFETVMVEHEALISNLLGVQTIRQTRFSDLPGEVKSLGAWGGDFCMLTWHDKPNRLPSYLRSKGVGIWFNFSEIVLSQSNAIFKNG